jgi:hypothetical protein
MRGGGRQPARAVGSHAFAEAFNGPGGATRVLGLGFIAVVAATIAWLSRGYGKHS